MIRTTGYTGETAAREYASSREKGEADRYTPKPAGSGLCRPSQQALVGSAEVRD